MPPLRSASRSCVRTGSNSGSSRYSRQYDAVAAPRSAPTHAPSSSGSVVHMHAMPEYNSGAAPWFANLSQAMLAAAHAGAPTSLQPYSAASTVPRTPVAGQGVPRTSEAGASDAPASPLHQPPSLVSSVLTFFQLDPFRLQSASHRPSSDGHVASSSQAIGDRMPETREQRELAQLSAEERCESTAVIAANACGGAPLFSPRGAGDASAALPVSKHAVDAANQQPGTATSSAQSSVKDEEHSASDAESLSASLVVTYGGAAASTLHKPAQLGDADTAAIDSAMSATSALQTCASTTDVSQLGGSTAYSVAARTLKAPAKDGRRVHAAPPQHIRCPITAAGQRAQSVAQNGSRFSVGKDASFCAATHAGGTQADSSMALQEHRQAANTCNAAVPALQLTGCHNDTVHSKAVDAVCHVRVRILCERGSLRHRVACDMQMWHELLLLLPCASDDSMCHT